MSFFDKLFNHKSINNKNENELKTDGEPLNFRPSNLHISKEQIRFILYRECDRRGRKLLFDSNAVEKLELSSKENCRKNQACHPQRNKKDFNIIETNSTHAYKYKKFSDDAAFLGEMIFGSVAMTYKGENICKIHKIPSPKQLMFTTIIHAPIKCLTGAINECSLKSSDSSLMKVVNEKETSSSDSKLYKHTGVLHKCPSTYPWISNASACDNLTEFCDTDGNSSLRKNSGLYRDNKLGCFGSLFTNNEGDEENMYSLKKETQVITEKVDFDKNFSVLSLSQKSSGCERNSSDNVRCTPSSVASSESENVSSVSGSLSSLRRRWAQSFLTSLDSGAYLDLNSISCKKRAKLGMALVLDIRNTENDEIENFLFNHTILMDNIMRKLQSSVEVAYIKHQNFVDLLYTAFLDAQRSIYEFITCGKYAVPVWITLIGDSNDGGCAVDDDDVDNKADCQSLLYKSSSLEKNKKTCSKKNTFNNAKLKFLNDFYDVLLKFDTKDTNFFISTLLTAVLTHHLSWVTAIAETDASNRPDKLQSVIKNYNPIWAQLNDLYGLLGSPLNCAKTIITGSESKRSYISAILQVLIYFIRCFNVVENVFDVDIDDIVGGVESSDGDVENFNRNLDSVLQNASTFSLANMSEPSLNKNDPFDKATKSTNNVEQDCLKKLNFHETYCKPGGTLKRNKSCLSQLDFEDSAASCKIYPDITELIKSENARESDLNYGKGECTFGFNERLRNDNVAKNNEKVKGNQSQRSNSHREECWSANERRCTLNPNRETENIHEKRVELEKQKSCESRENIVFVLGDNEKLVNLQKKVIVTRPDFIEFESEDLTETPSECGLISKKYSTANTSANDPSESEKDERTCDNLKEISDEALRTNLIDNNSDNSNVKVYSQGEPRDTPSSTLMMVQELRMPSAVKPSRRKILEVSSVIGGVNQKYNSEQIIQGVLDSESQWEQTLRKDLFLCAYNSTVEKDISEALCIVGDVDSWEVSVRSSSTSILDRNKHTGVRVGMSQLVADMLESFLCLCRINLPPDFCFLHIEKKLFEIYLKSKTVAEVLNSTNSCTIDYLTTRLDIGINDIPLLLSVATTHSPQISEKYGLSFT